MPRRKIGYVPLTNAEKQKRFRQKRNAVAKLAEQTVPLPYKLDADDIAKGALDPNNLNIEDRIRQLLTSERRWSSDFVVWVGKWAGRRHPKKAKRRKPAEPTLQDYWPTTLLQSCDLPLQ